MELLASLRLEGVLPDHVHYAIARGDVAGDLESVPVHQHEVFAVYPNLTTMAAFGACERTKPADRIQNPLVTIRPGAQLHWNGVPWTLVNLGHDQAFLRNEQGHQSLPLSLLEELVREGQLTSSRTDAQRDENQAATNLMLMATETELAAAHRRLELIQPRLLGVAGAKLNRTQQRFLAAYKAAQLNYGNGFVGLIPKTSRSGNREPRLLSEVIELVKDEINTHYLSDTQINRTALHGFIRERCRTRGLPAPSYGWLCKFVKAIPQDLLALARSGEKAAYKHQPRVEEKELSAALEPVRPFERVHVDHTFNGSFTQSDSICRW